MRIGLVGCVKTKRVCAAAAKDLYISPLFKGRRQFVERSCDRWFILSALHGLVPPEQILEPYDETLVATPRGHRRLWAERVLHQIDDVLGNIHGDQFELHAGADYLAFGIEGGLTARGATVDNPVRGLSQGQQLAFYIHRARTNRDGG